MERRIDKVASRINAKGANKAEGLVLDVSKAADVEAEAQQILTDHGRIDLLVNSAGVNAPKRSWADSVRER